MKKLRKLRCRQCNYETWKKFDVPADDLDSKCPKCGTSPMLVKIRLTCEYDGCKRFSIVEGDPHFNNYNFYSKKYNQVVDIRNLCFVCSDHEEEHEEMEKSK